MILEALQERNEQGHAIVETFMIQRHRNSENLHLRLTGVFDPEAALSLLDELNENQGRVSRIFVHTGALDHVFDSGVELFRSILDSLDRPGAEIIFTGKAGKDMAGKAPGVRFMR